MKPIFLVPCLLAWSAAWADQPQTVVSSVSVYNTAASFAAAVSGAVTYGFNGTPLPPVTGLLFGPQTVAGVTFNSTGFAFLLRLGSGSTTYGAQFFSGQSPNANPSDVVVTLAGTQAIAFKYGAYATTTGTPITVTLSTGDVYTQLLPPIAGTDTNFLGFVSTTPITKITLATVANVASPPPIAYSLDIVNFTLASPVPEPAAWVLGLLGVGLLGLRKGQREP